MYQEQQEQNNTLDTTHVVSHRKMAQTINSIVSTKLPSFNSNKEFFTFNGMPAKRIQFSLQNAFALTVHKTQDITLPHSTLSLDESIFACGQAYVAISRSPFWNKLDITSFSINSIKTDRHVLKEY